MHKYYYDVLLNFNGQAKKAFLNRAKMNGAMSSLVRWKFHVPLPTVSRSSRKGRAKSAGLKSDPEMIFSIHLPHSSELPTINPNFHTRPQRYAYGLPQAGMSVFLSTIVKTDTVCNMKGEAVEQF